MRHQIRYPKNPNEIALLMEGADSPPPPSSDPTPAAAKPAKAYKRVLDFDRRYGAPQEVEVIQWILVHGDTFTVINTYNGGAGRNYRPVPHPIAELDKIINPNPSSSMPATPCEPPKFKMTKRGLVLDDGSEPPPSESPGTASSG